MSDSLWPCGLQHARPPYPSLTPGVYSNSSLLSQWCHPNISSSVDPFSSCLQSFPASGSFPVSRLFTKGGQSVGASASASVLPMYIQDWFPLGLTGLISFLSRGLSRVFFSSTVGKHQPSFWSTSPICTWLLENHSFNYMDLCWQSDLIFKVLIIWLQWSNCIDYFSPTWILV